MWYNGIVKKISTASTPRGRCFFAFIWHSPSRSCLVLRANTSSYFKGAHPGRLRGLHKNKKERVIRVLTEKQEKFVQGIISGLNQADAYRNAYNASKMSDNAIYREASLLMSTPKVAQRIKELRDQSASGAVMSARERMEWLSDLIRSENETTTDKLKAVDLINKMSGEYVQKVEADVKQAYTIHIDLIDDEDGEEDAED